MTVKPVDGSGVLCLVVGPSGAGKDTLLSAAKRDLAHDPRFVFPRREITRPAEAGGEDHIAVSDEAYARSLRDGDYALAWRAHGLGYGVRGEVLDDLLAGRTVVLNASRSVLEDARARFARLRIIEVTAPEGVLAARLAARRRATDGDLNARLARAAQYDVTGPDVIQIINDGPVAQGAASLLRALQTPLNPAS